LHINENYRGLVVRKLKSMDWNRPAARHARESSGQGR
jgi:hypothetical protein